MRKLLLLKVLITSLLLVSFMPSDASLEEHKAELKISQTVYVCGGKYSEKFHISWLKVGIAAALLVGLVVSIYWLTNNPTTTENQEIAEEVPVAETNPDNTPIESNDGYSEPELPTNTEQDISKSEEEVNEESSSYVESDGKDLKYTNLQEFIAFVKSTNTNLSGYIKNQDGWHIVVGSYSSKSEANKKVNELQNSGFIDTQICGKYNGLYTITVACFETKSEAKEALSVLNNKAPTSVKESNNQLTEYYNQSGINRVSFCINELIDLKHTSSFSASENNEFNKILQDAFNVFYSNRNNFSEQEICEHLSTFKSEFKITGMSMDQNKYTELETLGDC